MGFQGGDVRNHRLVDAALYTINGYGIGDVTNVTH